MKYLFVFSFMHAETIWIYYWCNLSETMDGQHTHAHKKHIHWQLDKSLHRNRGHINVSFCFYSFNFWSELSVKTWKNLGTGNLSQENCLSIVFKALAVSLKGCNESGSALQMGPWWRCRVFGVCVCVCLGVDICKLVLAPCRHHQ